MNKTIQIGRLTITNGNVSPYIGHDDRFIPCLYFKHSHRQRATLALADYLSKRAFDSLNTLGSFINGEESERVGKKIHEAYMRLAMEQINNPDYPIKKHGEYYFTYLPNQKIIKNI